MKHLYYGWVLVIVSACVLSVSSFGMYAYGVFIIPLATDYGWGRGVISGAFSIALLVTGPLSIVVGRINDKYGPRFLATFSGLVNGIGFLLLARINSLWQLYFINLVRGVAGACAYAPIMTNIPRWFTKKRGIALGIASAGFGLGGVISPILAQWFISAYDWRHSFTFLGLITIVVIIPLAQFMRLSPQRMGLKPYGEEETIEIEIEEKEPAVIKRDASFVKAIKTKRFWFFGLILFCFYFTLQAVVVHIAPYAVDAGISATTAASMISVIAGTSVIGRLSTGFISEKIGSFKCLLISVVLATLALTWLLFSEGSWMLYLFSITFGFAYGVMCTIETLIPSELFGVSHLGIIYGALTFLVILASAIGPPIAGSIFDLTGNYNLALLIFVLTSAIAVVLSLILKKQTVIA